MMKRRILGMATILFGLLIVVRDDVWEEHHATIQRDIGRYHRDNQSCSPAWSLTNAATGHAYGLMYWSDVNYVRKLPWREDRKFDARAITESQESVDVALSVSQPDIARYWIGKVADDGIDAQIEALDLSRIVTPTPGEAERLEPSGDIGDATP